MVKTTFEFYEVVGVGQNWVPVGGQSDSIRMEVMVLDNGPKGEMRIVIKRFQKIDKYCNENPDFVWFQDKKQPEGMDD